MLLLPSASIVILVAVLVMFRQVPFVAANLAASVASPLRVDVAWGIGVFVRRRVRTPARTYTS
jgi:hypothetical protein